MGKVVVLMSINAQELVWEILENEPASKFSLVMLQEGQKKENQEPDDYSHIQRMDQPFDPMTEQGTAIVHAFGTPVQLGETRIWIVANIPTDVKSFR